jgi:hypothetical protein
MRLAVVSGWAGDEWKKIADATFPAMAAYAARHGADFLGGKLKQTGRPSSWSKLIAIADAIGKGCDAVAWVDADVAVHDHAAWIFDLTYPMAAVRATCPSRGEHWCLGVWVVHRRALPVLMQAAMKDECIHHPWWEQAAINDLSEGKFRHLHPSYNAWTGQMPEKVRFFHACGQRSVDEKLDALRKWL